MSYCVNCGVELDNSAKRCPLCETPVINPNKNKDAAALSPFPEEIVLPPKNTKQRYIAFIISMVMLLPNIVCIITNLLLTPHMMWSVYVVSSCAIFWFLFISPFLVKKPWRFINLAIDAVAAALYIFIFYYYNSDRTGWFLRIAIPIDIAFFLTAGLLFAYFKKKRTRIQCVNAVLIAFTAFDAVVCLAVDLFRFNVIVTYITGILAVSALIMLIFFVTAGHNKKLKAWISKKLFY